MITSEGRTSSDAFTPDLTPLLDIIFIVMVFLLLTANIHIETMQVDIPQTSEESVLESPEQDVIAISIINDPSQPWGLQGRSFAQWSDFTQAFLTQMKQTPNKPVVIAADKKSDVESMLKLLAFLQSNQINATNIVMEEQ